MKTIQTNNGSTLQRASRWIKIRTNYNPSKRNILFDYARDGELIYFKHNGKSYAINQFMRTSPDFFEDENGKTSYISGYDIEQWYNPYLIEIDECGEYIRLYQEI